MFELTSEEYNSLRSQIGTLEKGAHSKYGVTALEKQENPSPPRTRIGFKPDIL